MSAAGPDPSSLERVAEAALSLVPEGATVGLGSGRAAEAFIRALAAAARSGLEVRGVATSERSEALARNEGLEVLRLGDLARLGERGRIAVAFDGADEVSPSLDLTKGRGGALLRERVVAFEASRLVVLVTEDKLVARLGEKMPVPVEVVPFAAPAAVRHLERLGRPGRRLAEGGAPYLTDNGNLIFDVATGPLEDPARFHREARAIPGVVDTGLFLGMAERVLVGAPAGVRSLVRSG